MDHELFENAQFAVRVYRYQQTTLHHQLCKSYRFERNRFAPGIGTADDEYALFFVQADVDRYGGFIVRFVIEVEQRMIGLYEFYLRFVDHHGQVPIVFKGEPGLGTDEIVLAGDGMVGLE